MKIALCQINPIIGDINGNRNKIIDGYRTGVQKGADLVIFPELALCGYPPLDLIEKKEFRDALNKMTGEIAALSGSVGLLFGTITEELDSVGTGVYNSAVLCYEGKIQFIQHKTLLPNYDVFDEVRYFEPAKEVHVHEFKGERLGISICEDIWNDADYWKRRRYHVDPVQRLVEKFATVLINISASPYAYGRRLERFEMLSTLTRDDKLPLAYVCTVGAQTDLIFDGASMCFDKNGSLVKLGKTYREDLFLFDTQLDSEPVNNIEEGFESEVLQSLILGLKDYASKIGFTDALVGLSGGIDSALVTYLAVEAFGADNVHVVLMPSKFSSKGSVDDSIKLIDKLGISHNIVSIQPVFDTITEQLKPVFGNTPENVAEENIQARIRGLYLMAISNKFNYLLCSTGNKSEMSVGYATLYGDMNGALSVIADVYKTQVYKLAEYINREGEIIPRAIIEKAPSAELRPDQTDQDSLPPYEFLDKVLMMYLEEYKEYNEIVERFGEAETIRKILRMVDMNEFKRKQAAPVLRVSKKAFGYGRRYPIVQKWRRIY